MRLSRPLEQMYATTSVRVSPVVAPENAEQLRRHLGILPTNSLIGVPDCIATGYGSGLDSELIRVGALAETERYNCLIDTVTLYVSSRAEFDNQPILAALDALIDDKIAKNWAARIRTPEQARAAVDSARVRRIEIPFGSITDEMLRIVGQSSAHVSFAVPASIGSAVLVALARSTGIDEIIVEVVSEHDVAIARDTLATIDAARGIDRSRAA